MEKYQLKTDIMCQMCVNKVKPHFDASEKIGEWEVDLKSKDRILTVNAENLDVISQQLEIAGYKGEVLSS
ncbi:MAG: hypothetical protein LAT68_15980 [Cyclobacteriaceae bacterium]|nr:hypothetical protein [Cyclobacteriaceae bacterium]MCH8517818.1 hypothetical protein [Cyclobacteriaceae bacterium]